VPVESNLEMNQQTGHHLLVGNHVMWQVTGFVARPPRKARRIAKRLDISNHSNQHTSFEQHRHNANKSTITKPY
jgi:hypothetical protein